MKELEIWRLPTKLTEKPEKSVLFYEEKEGGKEMVVADTFAYSGLVPGCAMLWAELAWMYLSLSPSQMDL